LFNRRFLLGVAVGLAAGSLLRRANQQGLTQERLTDYYRRRAANYNATDQLQLFGRYPRIEMRQATMRLADLQPGDKVLDFACGAGANFPYIMDRIGPTGKLVGVDYSPEMLEAARKVVDSYGWDNVELIQSDAATMQPGTDFDVVISTLGLVVIPRHELAMQQALDALKPDGKYVVADLCESERWYGRPLAFIMDVLGLFIITDTGRRPWEWLAQRLNNFRREEIFHGFFYAAVGTKPK